MSKTVTSEITHGHLYVEASLWISDVWLDTHISVVLCDAVPTL